MTTLLAAGALGAAPAVHARAYSAEPVEATVVDAMTGRPVPGALVVARWILRGGGGVHGARDLGSIESLETLTDAQGRFAFPGWGPKEHVTGGALLDDDPLILVFKRGYHTARLGNGQYRAPASKDFRSRRTGPVRASLWNGETVALKPFAGDAAAFAEAIYARFIASDLWPMFAEDTPCDWQRLPRTVSYLEAEKAAYVAAGADGRRIASLRDRLQMNESFFTGRGCASPRAYLKEAP